MVYSPEFVRAAELCLPAHHDLFKAIQSNEVCEVGILITIEIEELRRLTSSMEEYLSGHSSKKRGWNTNQIRKMLPSLESDLDQLEELLNMHHQDTILVDCTCYRADATVH